MGEMPSIDKAYKASDDVVAREVQGEFILVPVTSGIGDFEDEIYTLNEAGRAIWDRLNGKRSLRDVAKDLREDFEGVPEEIEQDVLGITEELLKRRMLVEVG